MSNKLNDFISQHRPDFDTAQPSEQLWQKIDSGIKKTVHAPARTSWLKYILPASCAVALLVYAAVKLASGSPQRVSAANLSSVKDALPVEIQQLQTLVNEAQDTTHSLNKHNKSSTALPVTEQKNNDSVPDVLPVTPPAAGFVNSPAVAPAPASSYTRRVWYLKDKSLKMDTLFDGIKKLVINCASFEVNIHSHDESSLLVKADVNSSRKGLVIGKENYKITCLKRDSVLMISVECTSWATLVVGSFIHKTLLDLEVPKTTNIVVSNTYGDVSAKDLFGTQCVIRTESGNIRLDNINTGVVLDAGYGNITVRDIRGFLTANSRSGNISACSITGNMTVKSSYGNQTYKNIGGNLVSTCTSGDVKVEDMRGNAYITAAYGNVTLDNYTGTPVIDASSGDIRGKQIQLTGNMLLTNKYGDIKMDLLNDLKTLSFDLKTNYGKVVIDKGNERLSNEKQLSITNGTILIKGFTNSGDQYYK